jgi:dephospho-CoA kinase
MIIGLTGGIGSGKSTVARMFTVLGVPVYHSDDRAKELYFDEEVRKKVTSLLGPGAYFSDGKLNKSYISEKIFKDSALLHLINAIIHPAVGADFRNFIENNKTARFIVKESALLFEAGIEKQVDKIILVTAPLEIKLKRVRERDRSSDEEILQRMNNQLPDEKKTGHSHFVIINDEEKAVIPQVLSIYNLLNV